jgi:hypothetical protein
VRGWLDGSTRGMADRPEVRTPFPWLTRHAYVYLLGLYLGDGYVVPCKRRVFALRLYLDERYPRVVAEARTAVELVNPSGRAGISCRRDARMRIVTGYSKSWPTLLPQHGPGPKHTRDVGLRSWQRGLCEQFPARLLRGLIHSDGCRTLNRVRSRSGRSYSYPRYQLSNRSEQILELFESFCALSGIHCTRSSPWTVSVARRESVGRLDLMVGPKA